MYFKIGITGPESSGKTTLANNLSVILKSTYIPEFAREYLEQHGPNYNLDDVLHIANKQIENIILSKSKLAICDTEALVLKIWLEEKFNHHSVMIENSLCTNLCDLYILCKPDIPWEQDDLRENPNDRDRLFDKYYNYLIHYNLKFIIVEGTLESRILKSVDFINDFINQ